MAPWPSRFVLGGDRLRAVKFVTDFPAAIMGVRVGHGGFAEPPARTPSLYNKFRTHLSLNKNSLFFRRAQKLGRITATPFLGGLHHQYVRVKVFE
jgi:hypothetical protein